MRLLIDHGAHVNSQSVHCGSVLQVALSRGHKHIVELLIEKSADVNAQGGKYSGALQTASSRGREQIERSLIDKNADINAQGEIYGKCTPSHFVWVPPADCENAG